jgi:anti-anti-sigma regulatory factor
MLRITEHLENGKAIRLRLDGTISTETYSDLEEIFWRHHRSDSRTIILDMAGVNYMNEESARKIASLRSDRLRIINCSPFIVALLQAVGTEDYES